MTPIPFRVGPYSAWGEEALRADVSSAGADLDQVLEVLRSGREWREAPTDAHAWVMADAWTADTRELRPASSGPLPFVVAARPERVTVLTTACGAGAVTSLPVDGAAYRGAAVYWRPWRYLPIILRRPPTIRTQAGPVWVATRPIVVVVDDDEVVEVDRTGKIGRPRRPTAEERLQVARIDERRRELRRVSYNV